jgi:hypothetical protein
VGPTAHAVAALPALVAAATLVVVLVLVAWLRVAMVPELVARPRVAAVFVMGLAVDPVVRPFAL